MSCLAGAWMRLPQRLTRLQVGLMLALACTSAVACCAEELVLNDTNESPFTTPTNDGFLDIVAGEAFRRAGYTLKLIKLPPERGLMNANAGIEDGDLTRIAGLEQTYPNLVRVPEKLVDWHFVAFARTATITDASWRTLEPLSVAYIKGWKIYEKSLLPATRSITADSPEQLFAMVENNRIDVALYERSLGSALAKKMRITALRVVEPALAVREMFIYLNTRHADKVSAIASSLRAIKAEGLYSRVCRERLAAVDAPTTQCEMQ